MGSWNSNESKALEILLRTGNGESKFEENDEAIRSLEDKGLVSIKCYGDHLKCIFDPDEGSYSTYELDITAKGAYLIEKISKDYKKMN